MAHAKSHLSATNGNMGFPAAMSLMVSDDMDGH